MNTRWRRRVTTAALLTVLGVTSLAGAPAAVRAAEYTMNTVASYVVTPNNRQVSVSVDVTFENTTPDPAGQFSLFEVVDLALHPGASDVTARDGEGTLNVSVAQRDGFTLASVRPRQGVRYQQKATFTLGYLLSDGVAPGIRIGPSMVAFPVWSFGTRGSVSVQLPDEFDVTVDGDELIATRSDGTVMLTSGDIADPSAWLAQIEAMGAESFQTLTRAVPLASGTVDLQVRAWADDEAWGQATLDLLAAALPVLEGSIGLPYPAAGPLVVTESVSGPEGVIDEGTAEGTQLQAGYNQPPFTLLHQAAHVWFSVKLASDRWIREGFASLAAAEAASGLDVDLPYDSQARADELADSAFPLVSWGVGDTTDDQQAWAYAAAWAVAADLASAVGEDALRHAWRRIAAGVGPYEPVSEESQLSEHPTFPGRPTDSRELLDELEAVSRTDVAAIFGRSVFDAETVAALPDRADARTAFDELLQAAGAWGAPDPVKADLSAWRFGSGLDRMTEARAWLLDRDALMVAAEVAGLTLPSRLRDRYRTAGGGADARAELDAERAVVDAYQEVRMRSSAERGPLERIGLLGGPEPSAMLSDASALFAEGELRGAADAVAEARARLERASTDGIVRLIAAVVVGIVLILLAFRLTRRRRRPSASDYTAAP